MNKKAEQPTDSRRGTKVRSSWWSVTDFFLTLLVFYLFAGTGVPDVNEPHYWTKGAHFWDRTFGQGDIFLESGDAHWFFYLVFCWLTLFFSLEQSVWIGRWVTWTLLAVGWTFLLRSLFATYLRSPGDVGGEPRSSSPACRFPIVAAVAAPIWLAGLHWGNWAGEWVVGGCESKGPAYAFFFLGLGLFTRSKWTLGWTCIGLGSAFHVVTGLWVIATVGLASIWIQLFWDRVGFGAWSWMHRAGWGLCLAGFLAGAIPAIQMDRETPRDEQTQAAVAQVYKRLGHHLSPSKFSQVRWRGAAWLLGVSAVVVLLTSRARWSFPPRPSLRSERATLENRGPGVPPGVGTATPGETPGPRQENSSQPSRWGWVRYGNEPFRWLAVVSCIAFGFALTGLAIDFLLSERAPQFAASILRFYWFRWNEVVWPLTLSVVVVAISLRFLVLPEGRRRLVATLGMFVSIWILWERVDQHKSAIIPPGERQNFLVKQDTPDDERRYYTDWIAVCNWIRENIDDDGLWLTPRRQQSFKWRTHKAELACWKDMPQNAADVVLWNDRIQSAYTYDEKKRLLPLTEEKLRTLAREYPVRYLLLDMRVAGQQIPSWKQLYPSPPDLNATFVVIQVPDNIDEQKEE